MLRFTDNVMTTKRVTVNCKEKTVEFENMEEKNSSLIDKINQLSNNYVIITRWFIFLWFIHMITLFILCIFGSPSGTNIAYITYSLFVAMGIPFIIMFFFYMRKDIYFHYFIKMSYAWQKYIIHTTEYHAEVTELDTTLFEIPLFRNYILRYETEGDFSRFLKTIKIREHPFMEFVKGKSKKSDFFWKAQFIFEQIPKTGKLIVYFI